VGDEEKKNEEGGIVCNNRSKRLRHRGKEKEGGDGMRGKKGKRESYRDKENGKRERQRERDRE